MLLEPGSKLIVFACWLSTDMPSKSKRKVSSNDDPVFDPEWISLHWRGQSSCCKAYWGSGWVCSHEMTQCLCHWHFIMYLLMYMEKDQSCRDNCEGDQKIRAHCTRVERMTARFPTVNKAIIRGKVFSGMIRSSVQQLVLTVGEMLLWRESQIWHQLALPAGSTITFFWIVFWNQDPHDTSE